MKLSVLKLLSLAVASAVVSNHALGVVTLTRLGDLPGGYFHSEAHDVSNDGLVVVGRSISSRVLFNNYFEAFRWERFGFGSAMEGLGDFDESPYTSSAAYAITGDRSVIVGVAESWDEDNLLSEYSAFKSKRGLSPMTPLFIGDNVFLEHSHANDVSANGRIVVGSYTLGPLQTGAFLWDTGNLVELNGGIDQPGNLYGVANAVDDEGTKVVGTTYDDPGWIQAACWKILPGSVEFKFLTNSSGAAYGISADGKVAVGVEEKLTAKWPFYFNLDESGAKAQYLEWLPGIITVEAEARDISRDYAIIVGWCSSPDPLALDSEAVMWVKTQQPDQSWKYMIHSLNDWIDANSSINRDGFVMTQANAISDNGQTIVGTGYHESTGYEAFRLRISGEDFEGFFMGHEVEDDGRTVDTGDYLGPVDISHSPNIYSHELGTYLWFAEDTQSDRGAWFWVYR